MCALVVLPWLPCVTMLPTAPWFSFVKELFSSFDLLLKQPASFKIYFTLSVTGAVYCLYHNVILFFLFCKKISFSFTSEVFK